jgi:hypothetical protein
MSESKKISKGKKLSMSKKMKRQIIAFTTFLALLMAGISAYHINNAYAKNQANKKTPAEMMAKYSYKPKGQQNNNDNIRVSRLSQMNIVSEAANVLNILPINIMKEMEKGKTLEQIANEKGISKDQFLKKMADFENKTVDAAVKAGRITEEHQKALKEGQKDRLTKSLKLKAENVTDHKAMDMGN